MSTLSTFRKVGHQQRMFICEQCNGTPQELIGKSHYVALTCCCCLCRLSMFVLSRDSDLELLQWLILLMKFSVEHFMCMNSFPNLKKQPFRDLKKCSSPRKKTKLPNLLEARIIFLYALSLSNRRTNWVMGIIGCKENRLDCIQYRLSQISLGSIRLGKVR